MVGFANARSSWFLLLAVCACSASTEGGTEVRVVAAPPQTSAGSTFESQDGLSVRVDALSWTVAAIELHPCRSAMRRVLDAFVPDARAHGAGTPTRLAVPVVQSLRSTQVIAVGVLHPPALRYCSATLTVDRADDDARGLEENSEMLGKSLAVEGAILDAPLREIHATTSSAASMDLPIDVDLAADSRSVGVSMSLDVQSWLAAVDASELAEAALSDDPLRRLAEAIRLEVR